MLHGKWTMVVYSSSSSEDEADEENGDGVARQPRTRITPSQPLQPQPEPRENSKTTTASPLDDDIGPWVRCRKDRVKGLGLDRPRLRKKAQTAPHGGFDAPPASPPLEPRRAVSARLGYTNTAKRTRPNSCHKVESALDTRRCPRDRRLGPQRALPAPPAQDDREAISAYANHPLSSFSDKARVRRTLRRKHLEQLDTAIADDESRRSPASPSSMLSTPRELYAIPEPNASCETSGSPQSSCARRRKAANIILPEIRSPSTRSNVRCHRPLKRKHNNGDVDVAEKRTIYLPGAIMLARHLAKLRRDSVATLDAFTFDTKLEPSEERYSDMVGLKGIVTFFEDFGVVAEATEATLDKYWLRESQGRRKSDDAIIEGKGEGEEVDARKVSVSSVMDTGHPRGDWTVQSPRGSKFSFSSASSTTSVPPPEKRKRNRLRDLLSPGLPGSAFLKSPASRGQ